MDAISGNSFKAQGDTLLKILSFDVESTFAATVILQ